MRFKAEKPGRLGRAKAGRSNIPAQKFSLLADLIHTTGTLIKDETMPGVSNTPRRAQNRHPQRTLPSFVSFLDRSSHRLMWLMRPQPCAPREIVVCFQR